MKKEKIYVRLLAGMLTIGSIVHGSKQDSSMPGLGRGNRSIASRTVSKVPRDVSGAALVLADALLRDGKKKLAHQVLEQVNISYEEEFLPRFNPKTKPFDEKAINEAKMCFVGHFLGKKPFLCEDIRNAIKSSNYKYAVQLGPNEQMIVAQYLNSIRDTKNLAFVCSKNRALLDKFRKNHWPITKRNKGLFPNIETQVIYTPFDYIKSDIWRYIIAHPVTEKEIKDYVKKLKPKLKPKLKHDDLDKKTIIFKYKIVDHLCKSQDACVEEKDNVFIENLIIETCNGWANNIYDELRDLKKPIIFEVSRPDMTRREIKEKCKCLSKGPQIRYSDYDYWKNYAKIIVRNVKQEHYPQIIEFLNKKCIPCQKAEYNNAFYTLYIDVQKDNKGEFWVEAFNEEEIKNFKDNLFEENEKKINMFPSLSLSEAEVDMGPDIFNGVIVDAKTPEELKHQLQLLLKDKNVREVRVPAHLSIPLQYAGCTKINGVLRNYNNPNADLFLFSQEIALDNVICKNVYSIRMFCFDDTNEFAVKNLYTCKNSFVGNFFTRTNRDENEKWKIEGVIRTPLSESWGFEGKINEKLNPYKSSKASQIKEKIEKFKRYVESLNLEYLSGFVNIENKPDELTDTEWKQVEDLKEKVEKIKIAMRGSILDRLKTMNPAYTLRNVRGDGNCGVYAVLQALHPEQNYLVVRRNSELWKNAQELRNALPAGHLRRTMAQNAGDDTRWIEDRDFQHFALNLRRNILFISEQNQFIEYDRNGNIRTYGSLEEAFEQKAQDAIIIYHNGIDHFQTVIPMPNA